MTDDLSTLVQDFETQINNENLADAETTLETIVDHYQSQRSADMTRAMRARAGDFSDEDVQTFLGTVMELKLLRSGFLSSAKFLVTNYEDLKAEDQQELDSLLTSLSGIVDPLSTLESDIQTERDAAAPIIDDADLPADVELLSASELVETDLVSGDVVDMEIVVANVGDSPAQEVSLGIEPSRGLVESAWTEQLGELAGGEQLTKSYQFEVDSYGIDTEFVTFSVDSADAGVGSTTIRIPRADERPADGVGPIEIDRLQPAGRTVPVGETVEISAFVTNEGDQSGDVDVSLVVGGEVVETTTLQGLAVQDPTPVTFELSVPGERGEFTYGLETEFDSVETTLGAVQVEPPSIEDYTNENGVVRTGGLRNAVDDWQDGLVDTALLQEIIDQWKTGDPVQ